ncbi:MAG: LTA synthase family protein [Xanthomonadales bacterium]|nr:LTA synthase family protein [Xanthomonadales bacterium]
MAVGNHKLRGRGLRRVILATACCLLVALALAVPVDWALQFLGTPADRIINAGLVLGLIALLGAAGLIGNRWTLALILLPVLVGALMTRLLFYGLVHFSGQGFGPELFLHFEPESLRIVWHEYDDLVYRAAGVALVGAAAFWGMVRAVARSQPPRWAAMVLALAAVPILIAGRGNLPEWQLWQAWQDWKRSGDWIAADRADEGLVDSRDAVPSISEDRAARWTQTGLIETDLPSSDEIVADTPAQPKNLVLLYVEALTTAIVEHPDYPGLMPNFRRLIREHGWIDEFHTSSFVTIEGVANTQCGLLFPFQGHGSGFAGRGMLAQSLPCLGDVLAEAGYHQTYILGGGPMSFTGKGAFLDAHGYDDLKGWEYWRSHGHEREPGHWGMGDVETLKQVRLAIAQRHEKGRPFNVTSLTVGSHIPGYVYDSCSPYGQGDERYLDALHCTDQVIGDWIERLQAEQLLEDTVLVIVGDHPVFANPEMDQLFGPAAHDTRLPFIVIGDDLQPPVHERGAGFDLAPTLLDLLGIHHNAKFAMGRSLAQAHDRPDYLVTRRGDIQRGRPVDNSPRKCDRPDHESGPDQPPSLPLSPCDKRRLLDLLHQLAETFSHRPMAMDCGSGKAAEIRVPAGDVGPVSFRVNGRDWSKRFSWRGRMTHPTEPGLYALGLDPKGRPTAATFLPAETWSAEAPEQLPQDILEAHSILVAWRPGDPIAVDLSSVLPALPKAQRGAGAWLARPMALRPVKSGVPGNRPTAVLTIDQPTCRQITQ